MGFQSGRPSTGKSKHEQVKNVRTNRAKQVMAGSNTTDIHQGLLGTVVNLTPSADLTWDTTRKVIINVLETKKGHLAVKAVGNTAAVNVETEEKVEP